MATSGRSCGGCGAAGAAWAHPALPGVAACGAACALACGPNSGQRKFGNKWKAEDDGNPDEAKRAADEVAGARMRLAAARAAFAAALPDGMEASIEGRAAALRALVADTSTKEGLAAAREARARALAGAAAAAPPDLGGVAPPDLGAGRLWAGTGVDPRRAAAWMLQEAETRPQDAAALLLDRLHDLGWLQVNPRCGAGCREDLSKAKLQLIDSALRSRFPVAARWTDAANAMTYGPVYPDAAGADILTLTRCVWARPDIGGSEVSDRRDWGRLSRVWKSALNAAVRAADMTRTATLALLVPDDALCDREVDQLYDTFRETFQNDAQDLASTRYEDGYDSLREIAALAMRRGLVDVPLPVVFADMAEQLPATKALGGDHRGEGGGWSMAALEAALGRWRAFAAWADALGALERVCFLDPARL